VGAGVFPWIHHRFYFVGEEFLRDARKNYGDVRGLQIFLKNPRKTIAALDELCKYSLEHS